MQIFALVFSANTRHKVAHTCRQPQDNQDMCKCVGWVGIRQCCFGEKMKFIRVAIGCRVIFSAAQQGKIGFLSQCRKYRDT